MKTTEEIYEIIGLVASEEISQRDAYERIIGLLSPQFKPEGKTLSKEPQLSSLPNSGKVKEIIDRYFGAAFNGYKKDAIREICSLTPNSNKTLSDGEKKVYAAVLENWIVKVLEQEFVKSNWEHISEHGKINGSLLVTIRKIANNLANETNLPNSKGGEAVELLNWVKENGWRISNGGSELWTQDGFTLISSKQLYDRFDSFKQSNK